MEERVGELHASHCDRNYVPDSAPTQELCHDVPTYQHGLQPFAIFDDDNCFFFLSSVCLLIVRYVCLYCFALLFVSLLLKMQHHPEFALE